MPAKSRHALNTSSPLAENFALSFADLLSHLLDAALWKTQIGAFGSTLGAGTPRKKEEREIEKKHPLSEGVKPSLHPRI